MRPIHLLVPLLLAACGSSVPYARVGAVVPAPPPTRAPAEGTTPLEVDQSRTRVEVVGADRLTGEHVARIASPDVTWRIGPQRRTHELVVIADLTTLEMDDADVESFVKSSDFLDVARFPEATFRSTRVEARADDRYRIRGVLSLHGISREIAFEASTSRRAGRRQLHANFLLPRRAFAIRRDDALDALISSDFRVRLVIEAALPSALPPESAVD